MEGHQQTTPIGKVIFYSLLVWAVIGTVAVFSMQDSESVTPATKSLIAWPIFLFITPPGWILLGWIWKQGTNPASGERPPKTPDQPLKPTGQAATPAPPSPRMDPATSLPPRSTPELASNSNNSAGARAASTLHTSRGTNTGPPNRSRPGATFDALMDQVSRRKLADRYGWICQLCLERIPDVGYDYEDPNPRRLSIDHIIPTSHGGSDELSNLQPVHFSCNSAKGGRAISNAEFRQRKATQESVNRTSGSTKSWLTSSSKGESKEPRPGDWRSANVVIQQLASELEDATLNPTQQTRAREFLRSAHPFELLKECQRGHLLSLENTYFRVEEDGRVGRECRQCKREASRS